jgi:uncharacterized integral membrane protein
MNSVTPLMVNYWNWIALFLFWLIAALFAHRTRSSEGCLRRLQHSIPLGLAFLLMFSRHRGFLIYGPLYGT